MSGGVRYWNEETQRWEDGTDPATGPVTPPPPSRPGGTPAWPPGVSGGTGAEAAPPAPPVWPPAAGADVDADPGAAVETATGSGPAPLPSGPGAGGLLAPGESPAPGGLPAPGESPAPTELPAPGKPPVGSGFVSRQPTPPVTGLSTGADSMAPVSPAPGELPAPGESPAPGKPPAGSGFVSRQPTPPVTGLSADAGSTAPVSPAPPPPGPLPGASPAPSVPPPAPPPAFSDAPAATAFPPSPPGNWPGTGSGSAWHGPGDSGGGWSSVEQVGGGATPSAEWSGAGWTTVGPAASPAPPAGRDRRVVWAVLGGVAVLGVVVALVLTTVVGGGKEHDRADDVSPSPTGVVSQQSDPYESPTPSPTEDTASPLASAPQLPAGYELYEDEEGFRIGRPKGWTRTTVPSQYGIDVVNYRSADGERRIQVYQIAEESPEASFALYLSDDTTKPDGFRKLALEPVDDHGFSGQRLEYVANTLSNEPDVGPWHVYDERFVAQDGFIYAIAAYGLEKDGPEDELELLDTALAGFCAPYACDPAAID